MKLTNEEARVEEVPKKLQLVVDTEAEKHFHSHFQVNSNVLARTKETLESYLVKRIAQLNNGRRALSTSKQSDAL